MDLSPFKLDIDELITDFAQGELKTLADIKKLWLFRKFAYIFQGRLSTNVALFMQSLYTHTISHMTSDNSLSHRLGALYCLYCLYETQPFKPPIKIYLSLGELQRLKSLVVNAKENGMKVVSAVVKRMLEKGTFLFGSVSITEYSEKERIKELVEVQNACIKKMHEKMLANTEMEKYLHMDLGEELDQNDLMKLSSDYAGTKSLAVREASDVVDVQDIKHIAEDNRLTIGDELQKLTEEWGNEKEMFSQQTRSEQQLSMILSYDIQNQKYKESNCSFVVLKGNQMMTCWKVQILWTFLWEIHHHKLMEMFDLLHLSSIQMMILLGSWKINYSTINCSCC